MVSDVLYYKPIPIIFMYVFFQLSETSHLSCAEHFEYVYTIFPEMSPQFIDKSFSFFIPIIMIFVLQYFPYPYNAFIFKLFV